MENVVENGWAPAHSPKCGNGRHATLSQPFSQLTKIHSTSWQTFSLLLSWNSHKTLILDLCYKTTINHNTFKTVNVTHSGDTDPWPRGKHSSSEEMVPHWGVQLTQMFCTRMQAWSPCSEQQQFKISLIGANPSRFCAMSGYTAWPGDPGDLVCGRARPLCPLDRNTVGWRCQYDLLLRTVRTSTPLWGRFLTREAFCLSQEMILGTVRNWTKEKVSGLQLHTHTHTHTSKFQTTVLSWCRRATGWPVTYH